MPKRRPLDGLAIPRERLDTLLEDATVDCYDEEEQATGFFAMIEEHLAPPFTTRILGAEVIVDATGAEWIAAYRHWASGWRD